MALRTRQDYYGCDTRIASQHLVRASRRVSSVTGIQVQRNKAIVGRNAFAHEAGIHQDGMLKERTTYEIMRPEDVGFTKTDLVLGKHSGRAALKDRAQAMGYHLTGEQLQAVFEQFKVLADKKKEVYDGDIAAIIDGHIRIAGDAWKLDSYSVTAASGDTPTVRLTLRRGKEQVTQEMACGDGPLDALFLAIEEATGVSVICRDFQVRSVTHGKDAQAEASVEAEYAHQIYRGRGVSTDSVEAGTRAFLDAINRIVTSQQTPTSSARR